MIITYFQQIAKLTNDCPNCGSDKLGNGKGTLIVDEEIYKRTCVCGFDFEYDTVKGVSRSKIKKAIKKALRDRNIRYCVNSVFELEGVKVGYEEFEKLSDDELNEKVEWFDYLWTK